MLQALHRTQQKRPADALAYFRGCLRQRPSSERVTSLGGEDWLDGRGVEVPEDPYG